MKTGAKKKLETHNGGEPNKPRQEESRTRCQTRKIGDWTTENRIKTALSAAKVDVLGKFPMLEKGDEKPKEGTEQKRERDFPLLGRE
jgi:hypothetical protein